MMRPSQFVQRPSALMYLFLPMLLAVAGCAAHRAPDLIRLYGSARHSSDQPPVILIHGILGSRLRHSATGKEVWVGRLSKLLFSDYEDLALQLDPESLEPLPGALQAFDITDQAAGTDFYGRILNILESAGGYRRGEPGMAGAAGERRYYIFLYDWRLDNVSNAARLDEFINQIRADHHDPGLKVDIVAHSMGGLLTRYYLRYGPTDVLDDNEFPVNLWGRDRVRRVVLLGTPNLGSVSAVRAFLEGVPLAFGRIPTEVLATMPSIYQLFPHPLMSDWLITTSGQPLKRDLFEARIWERFGWSIFDPAVQQRIGKHFTDPREAEAYIATLKRYFEKHIERARRFAWSLTVPMPETPWRLILFGGDCELTATRIAVEEVDGESLIRLYPKEIRRPVPGVDYQALMLEPGDGTVTKTSLLARNSLDPSVERHPHVFFPLDYSFFICESHDQLTGNATFQDNLLQVLLSR